MLNSLWDRKPRTARLLQIRWCCLFAGNRLNIYDSECNYKFSCNTIRFHPLLQINGSTVVNRPFPQSSNKARAYILRIVKSKQGNIKREAQLARPSCVSDRQTNADLMGTNGAFFLVFFQILFVGALFISYVFIFIFNFALHLHLPCQALKITTMYDESIL